MSMGYTARNLLSFLAHHAPSMLDGGILNLTSGGFLHKLMGQPLKKEYFALNMELSKQNRGQRLK
jgi:hypothetical protein